MSGAATSGCHTKMSPAPPLKKSEMYEQFQFYFAEQLVIGDGTWLFHLTLKAAAGAQ